MGKPSMLVVEDDAIQLETIVQWLTDDGWDVHGFASLRKAIANVRRVAMDYDVALVDIVFEHEKGGTGADASHYNHGLCKH